MKDWFFLSMNIAPTFLMLSWLLPCAIRIQTHWKHFVGKSCVYFVHHCIPRTYPSTQYRKSIQYISVEWMNKMRSIWSTYSNVVLVTQSCPTLCDPMCYSPPDSSVHRILWIRILEWVAILFSRGSSWPGIEPRSPAL